VGYTRVGDFLAGLNGLALLHSRVTDLGGKPFGDARIADLRRLLDHWDDPALQAEQTSRDARASEGYALWASTYDREQNPLISLEAEVVRPMLDCYPPGVALDAACGTGRWAAYLRERGTQPFVAWTSRRKCWGWCADDFRTLNSSRPTWRRCKCPMHQWTWWYARSQ